MIIKSYIESTAARALKRIREEMGQQALILNTRPMRDDNNRRQVEITACIDESIVPSLRSLIDDKKTSNEQEDKSSRLDSVQQAITDSDTSEHISNSNDELTIKSTSIVQNALTDFDIPKSIANEIIEKHDVIDDDIRDESVIRNKLSDYFNSLINTDLEISTGSKILFVGPSGAGKTSVIAKLAAELSVLRKIKVRLTSFDTQKISAAEEIGGYADILDAPYEINPKNVSDAGEDEVLLIDTPSMTFDPEGIEAVQSLINLTRPDLILMVLSVCNRASDVIEFKEGIRQINPHALVATHLDETSRWGTMITAVNATDIPLALVSDSPGGAGQMKSPDANWICDKLTKIMEANYDK